GNTLLAASRADFLTGLDRYLGEIENDLSLRLFGYKLPLIGDALARATGAQFVGDVRQRLVSDLGNAFTSSTTNPVQVVRERLFDTLGPSGMQILADITGDNQVTIDDVGLTNTDTNVKFDLKLVQANKLLDAFVGFDVGVPGLGLKVEGSLQVHNDYTWNLSFGVDNRVAGHPF